MKKNELKIQILSFLAEYKEATAKEIAESLNISNNLALTALRKYMINGLVKRKRVRQGRERYLYVITKRGFERLQYLKTKKIMDKV